MRTGVSISKTRNRATTIAAVTGSVALFALTITFVMSSYNNIQAALERIPNNDISVLEPDRSDATSEPVCDSESSGNNEIICSNDNCSDTNCPIHSTRPSIELSMDEVQFLSDSCEYANQADTMRTLSKYVEDMNAYFEQNPDGTIYLVGSIAKTTVSTTTDTALSQARAETVRQSFIELGIDSHKLVAIGLGISDPWREDEWQNGNFDESIAKKNRRVWLIPDCFEKQMSMVNAVLGTIESQRQRE